VTPFRCGRITEVVRDDCRIRVDLFEDLSLAGLSRLLGDDPAWFESEEE